MNVFRFEMRRNFRSFVIWTVSIAAFVVFMLSIFQSSFAGADRDMSRFVEMFPESFRKAFGIDRLDMTTMPGYFGTEVHLMIILFGAMYAVLLSSSLLSKEEDDKTIEFLLARPITRSELITQKALTFVTYVILSVGTNWLCSYAAMLFYDAEGFEPAPFWRLGLMTLLSVMAIASLGFFGSVFVTRNRAVNSASLGFVLALYALQIVTDVSDKAEFLRFVTPFKWASAADILPKGQIDPVYLALALAVVTLSIAGAYLAYGRKDITC